MKRMLALCLTFLMLAVPISAASTYDYTPDLSEYSIFFASSLDAWPDHQAQADALNHLGLFRGNGNDYELARVPNRMEALVTVIRLIGRETEALDQNIASTFTDIPAWAAAYAGYAQQNNLIQGIGNGLMGAGDDINARQYITMLLRVLGYSDTAGDFSYDKALEFALDNGLMTAKAYARFSKDGTLTRGDMAYFMYDALGREKRDGNLLILDLVEKGAVSQRAAYGTMLDKGESMAEIRRALSNGYSEAWLAQFEAAISSNSQISEIFAPTFRQSMYNWLKEAGGGSHVAQVKYNLSTLTTDIVKPSADAVFKNQSIVAYFMYPNKIVVRSDIDVGFEDSAFSHELRHALSGRLGIVTLEEGFTELFNQEVDGGHYGYQYHFVNIAKLFTHLIGAERINEIIYNGTYEDLFYTLESVSGMRIDKSEFRSVLYRVSETSNREEAYRQFAETMSQLIHGYYMKNNAALIDQPGGYQKYIDTLIACAQLLYFPSAMVRDAETNITTALPSASYDAAFETCIREILADRAAQTGESLSLLQNYYTANRDTRYCMKFFGADAGKMMVKNADAVRTTYKDRTAYSNKLFGRADEAAAFAQKVNVAKTEAVPGAAFTEKIYS